MIDLAAFYQGGERMYGRVMTDEDVLTCPYCKKYSHMEYVEGSARIVDISLFRVEAAYQCVSCNRFLIGGATYVGMRNAGDGSWVPTNSVYPHSPPESLFAALEGREQYWEPISPVGKTYTDVPPEIAPPADEAHRCFSIGAYRAAVLMGRAVIEAVAKHHEIDSGQLYSKIEQMGEKGVVRPRTVAAAHGVRDIGNDVAHGDFTTADVTHDDASNVLILMDVVLNDAFAGEHGLRKLIARADARQAHRGVAE